LPRQDKPRPRARAESARPATRNRRRANGAREIFETLRSRIAQQRIAPGAKLRETELADEFGVPRTRVREAINALQQRGMVERVPNRGAVVVRLDLSQLFHIYAVREVLEGLGARLAAQNAAPERWSADLALFEGPMKELVAKGDLDHYIENYERLRRRIIEAAANPVLAELIDILHEKTQVLIWRIIILPGRAEIGRQQHVAMLQAMCRGDGEEAERLRRLGLRSAMAAAEKYKHYIF
jgi:DNA-binding GntR family transcriptional regulator